MRAKKEIVVVVRLTKEQFIDVATSATRAGKRHGNTKTWLPKRNSPGEQIANTKGLGHYFLYAHDVCKTLDAEETFKVAAALKEKKAAEEKLKALGVVA